MTAVDTNIIIRLLTRDDEQQYKKAHTIFKNDDIFIPETVILETEWVLRYAYSFTPDRISKAFTLLLGLDNVSIANPLLVHQALGWFAQGMDFADAMHLAASRHCIKMKSFDKTFIKQAVRMKAGLVEIP